MLRCWYYLYFPSYLSISQYQFLSVEKIATALEMFISTEENIFDKQMTTILPDHTQIYGSRQNIKRIITSFEL